MAYALLFPGQGSQHADLLPWLEAEPAAAPVLQALAQRLGPDWRERIRDEDFRHANVVAQVLVTGCSLAAWAVLGPRLPEPPAIVAGYSVGELAAFSAAGALSVEQALRLAAQRAELMDRATAGQDTGLLSVSGLMEAQLMRLCAGLPLECGLRLGPDHLILAGEAMSLQEAASRLASQASCKRLPIRIASHSSWMREAALGFARLLAQEPFGRLQCPVALNASGSASRHPETLRQALSRQMDHTVEWASCMDTLDERGVHAVLEVGPGTALARLWSSRHPRVPVRAVEDFRTPAGVVDWVQAHRG